MPLFRGSAPVSSAPQRPTPPEQAAPTADAPLPRVTHDELLGAWAADLRPLTPRACPVEDALGLVLCEDLDSDLDLPLVDVAGVDGVGVRAANVAGASPDHPIDLRLVAVLEAGDPLPAQTLPPGCCVLLGQGAPVPAGVDAILPTADARVSGRVVTVTGEASVGDHVRTRGSDLAEGTRLASAGDVVGLAEQVRLVEAGQSEVLVRRRPRMGVVALGATTLAPGAAVTAYAQRYATGAALIAGLAGEAGVEVKRLGVVGRDVDALRAALDDTGALDVVCVVAGDDVDVLFAEDALADRGSVHAVHLAADGGQTLAHGRLGCALLVVVPAATPIAAAKAYATVIAPALAMLAARSWHPGTRRLGESVASRERWALASDAADGVRVIPDTPDAAAIALAAHGVAAIGARGAAAGDEVDWWPLPAGRP